MSQCIVFDQDTAYAVRARSGIQPEVHAEQPNAIMELALNSASAIAVLPATENGAVLLLRISRPRATSKTSKVPSNMAPAGVLGLSDSIDMDTEPEQPKKWWQKLLD